MALRPKRARPNIGFYRNIEEFIELIPRRKRNSYILLKLFIYTVIFVDISCVLMHTNIFCIKGSCMSKLLRIVANINAKKSQTISYFVGAHDSISTQHYIKTGNMKHDKTIRLNTSAFKLQISFELVRVAVKLPTLNANLSCSFLLKLKYLVPRCSQQLVDFRSACSFLLWNDRFK